MKKGIGPKTTDLLTPCTEHATFTMRFIAGSPQNSGQINLRCSLASEQPNGLRDYLTGNLRVGYYTRGRRAEPSELPEGP